MGGPDLCRRARLRTSPVRRVARPAWLSSGEVTGADPVQRRVWLPVPQDVVDSRRGGVGRDEEGRWPPLMGVGRDEDVHDERTNLGLGAEKQIMDLLDAQP